MSSILCSCWKTDFLEQHRDFVTKLARAYLASFEFCQICSQWTVLFWKAGSTAPTTFKIWPWQISPVLKSSQQNQKLLFTKWLGTYWIHVKLKAQCKKMNICQALSDQMLSMPIKPYDLNRIIISCLSPFKVNQTDLWRALHCSWLFLFHFLLSINVVRL